MACTMQRLLDVAPHTFSVSLCLIHLSLSAVVSV